MIRAMLILVQLGLPLLPAGPCTCPRPDQSSKKAQCACCHHEGGGECHCQTESSSKSRPPCQDPACPAHPSFARLETGVLSTPTVLQSPMIVSTVEPAQASASHVQRRTFDSTMVVSPQLFLVYGTMLI
jgi:hypothetical protein